MSGQDAILSYKDPRRMMPGTLWQLVRERTRVALGGRVLQPIHTEFQFVEDRGVRFVARIATSLGRKDRASGTRDEARPSNPFLPYDPALYVADVGRRHVCLLNKYNVVDHHLLVVTRTFEPQDTPLGEDDFSALASCMVEYDSLGFYNSGPQAGASQAHRHLQLVPLPLAASGPRMPLEPTIAAALRDAKSSATSHTVQAAGLPFQHRISALEPALFRSEGAGTTLEAGYRALRKDLGLDRSSAGSPPYNLLLTRQWMMMVPRVAEHYRTISLNALAFAGMFFVRDRGQLERLKRDGPLAALQAVAGRK